MPQPQKTPARYDPQAGLGLFWRRVISDPLRMGAIVPSGRGLARRMAREARVRPGEAVVELGPGTGAVTRALVADGVPEERLILVERDAHLHAFLLKNYPKAMVIRGDAADLEDLVPEDWRGRISTVVSCLPLVNLPRPVCDAIVEAAFAVLAPDGGFVQFTYSPFSPLRRERRGLEGRKVAFAAFNLPPATIWRYTAGAGGGNARPRDAASAPTAPGS